MWTTDPSTRGSRPSRMAPSAPARPPRFLPSPPRTLPKPLASLGSASSEYSDCDSRTGLPCIWRACGLRLYAQIARQIGAGLLLDKMIGVTDGERLFRA